MDTDKLLNDLIADYEEHFDCYQAGFEEKLSDYHKAVAVREALRLAGESIADEHIQEIEIELTKLEFRIDRCKITKAALLSFLDRLHRDSNLAQRFEKLLNRAA